MARPVSSTPMKPEFTALDLKSAASTVQAASGSMTVRSAVAPGLEGHLRIDAQDLTGTHGHELDGALPA